ncbi:MAG: hypothetical protein ABI379_02720 [Rhodanobacter sp.]
MLTFKVTSTACGIVLACLLTACGKTTPAPAKPKAATPPATGTAHPASAPAKGTPAAPGRAIPTPAQASTTFHVRAVTLGSAVDGARHINKPTTQFVPDDKTIYASVSSTGTTRDAALNARWNYLEGAGQLISSVTQRLASDGPATTTFTLHNPDLWPEGKYNVQISVDGKVVDTKTFTISK